MLEIVQSFEKTAGGFEPAVLIAGGIISVLLGLIIWLAGLRYAKLIAAAIGIFIVGGITYLATKGKVFAAVVLAIPGGLFTSVARKFILSAAAVLMAALITLAIVAAGTEKQTGSPEQVQYHQPSQAIPTGKALKITGLYIEAVAKETLNLTQSLTAPRLAAVLVAGAVTITAAIFFCRVVVAAGCSAAGVSLCAFGMSLLLIFKGALPITYIAGRVRFFFAAFAIMAVAGTFIELLVQRPRKGKPAGKEDSEGER